MLHVQTFVVTACFLPFKLHRKTRRFGTPQHTLNEQAVFYIEENTFFFSRIKPRFLGKPIRSLVTTNAEVIRLQCVQKLM